MEPVSSIYFFIMLSACSIAILLYRYAVTMKRFLKSFIKISKKVSNKEFHSRLQSSARGELGELARNFNFMMETMENTIEEVEYKHLQLTSVLKSISHGILVIDINGNIILINDEARNIIKSKCIGEEEGKNIKQVIDVDEILKGIVQHIGSKENHIENLTLEDETVYKLKIDPVYLQNSKNAIIGSIINIENITEIVKLENMRRDFVANVSHELKTQIALIQGYAEGLKENITDDEESKDFYCEVIADEAKKMNAMVKKLLTLNQIEFGNNQLSMQRFDVCQMIQNKINSSQILFKKKNTTVIFEEEAPVYVWADELMIEEVFSNYLSNALNHVYENGTIRIWFERMDSNLRIHVYNDGKCIPEEELNKLWIKFYKVDKARTREYGGNGIGLSIVAATMKAHGKDFGGANKENGVDFYFDLDAKIKS